VDEQIAAELARLAQADQEFRNSLPDGPLDPDTAMRGARLDVGHTDRLREIIDQHGWPGHRLVGEDGAEHAWLLAQHADRQLDFQRQALRLLTDAVQREDATPRQLAYLTDRVRVNEGREQVYGTQMRATADRQVGPWPIEDADQVDERRASVGLEPLADYRAQFQDE